VPPVTPNPEELLDRFGLRSFRRGQREAVLAALQGHDSLVVMPTGAGKSLCYQLPALAGGGLVLVVSPLIALMADQSQRLKATGVRAVMLASGMPEDHNAHALREIRSGQAQLVLATPERFASPAFNRALAARHVRLFAVDEAHCIAEWGHDFRPDYLRLANAVTALGRPPVMAVTATATPWVAQEIASRLGLRDWVEVRSGFDRPNITFDVIRIEGESTVKRKQTALLHALRAGQSSSSRPAIVYCGTRRETERLTQFLCEQGIATVGYHAGMPPADRRASQQAFMDDSAEVVVATSAFGMGIDKATVRTVVHWSIPTSLETYYQEAGRAGRDGQQARALLLAARVDLGRLIRFNTARQTTLANLNTYLARLAASAHGDILERSRPGSNERVLLSVAERSGALILGPGVRGGLRIELTRRIDTHAAWLAIKVARDRGWESYRTIDRFISNTTTCRRHQILQHFGDTQTLTPAGRCCEICEPDRALQAAVTEPATGEQALYPSRSTIAGAGDQALRQALTEERFQRLREWRRGRTAGKPAYLVACDAVLAEVLRTQPQSIEDLLAIRGIGPAFCEQHGESLLHALGVDAEPRGAPSETLLTGQPV
jgi:ATP-dependent DNA helicase RecQ